MSNQQTIVWLPAGERPLFDPALRTPLLLAMPALYSRPIHGWWQRGQFRSDISPNDLTEFVTHWAEPLEMPYPPRESK